MDRIFAIAVLRLRLMTRRLRGASGAVQLVAGAVLALLGSVVAIGLAGGFGALTYFAVRSGELQTLRNALLVAFYTFLVFGLLLPLITGAMNQSFDPSSLRIFPFSSRRLYVITLAASALGTEHLLYYPALATVGLAAIVRTGVNLPVGLAVLLLMASFYVVWSHALTMALASLVRRRRAREVVAIGAVLVLVSVSLAPSLLENAEGSLDVSRYPQLAAATKVALAVGAWLPPSYAAETLTALHAPEPSTRWSDVLWLVLWDGLGLAFGSYVFTRHVLGGRGVATRSASPSARGAARRGSWTERFSSDGTPLAWIPVEARAVAVKELRYLLRSVVCKFQLVFLPLLVAVFASIVGRRADLSILGLDSGEGLLFATLAYSTLLSNNFLNNAFAWEGEGARAYFTAPVSLERVLLGKNLGVWAYNALLLTIVLASWSLIEGPPRPSVLISAALLYATCVVAFTVTGNFISVLFPVSRDMSSLRNEPSPVGLLFSVVSLAFAILLVGLAVWLPELLGVPRLRPLALALVLAIVITIYSVALRLAAELMERRKERLVAGLRSTAS